MALSTSRSAGYVDVLRCHNRTMIHLGLAITGSPLVFPLWKSTVSSPRPKTCP